MRDLVRERPLRKGVKAIVAGLRAQPALDIERPCPNALASAVKGFDVLARYHRLDVHGLEILDPPSLERDLNQITGVVTVGLFAQRPADLLIVGSDAGVKVI